MLVVDPEKRISASGVMAHSWLHTDAAALLKQ